MSYLTEQLVALRTPQQPMLTPPEGRDLDCNTSVDARCTTIDPTCAKAAAQALVRRLQTPRGTLVDDDGYGFDLLGQLNKPQTRIAINQIESAIQAEAQEVEFIDRIVLNTTRLDEGIEVEITVYGKKRGDTETFRLTTSTLGSSGPGVTPILTFVFDEGDGWDSPEWDS